MRLDKSIANAVEESLQPVLGNHLAISDFKPVGGGCINNGGKLITNEGPFFIKYNDARYEGMFDAEAKGLRLLKNAGSIHIPTVYTTGKTSQNQIFIVLEWIESGSKKRGFWKQFGQELASLHKVSSKQFGLEFDNYIGSLPQYNTQHDKWTLFFTEERIERQIRIGQDKGSLPEATIKGLRALYPLLNQIFPDEQPALLHGDLWGGNFMVNDAGEPSLIDPAVYYGHREMELAFTKMFGGFDKAFYTSYHEAYPIEKGFDERKDLYNLYPLLVHVNLFGGAYLTEVREILRTYR